MACRALAALILAAFVALGGSAAAQVSDGVVRIGVLADMVGVYADTSGAGSVEAARMAVEDFGAAAAGAAVEVIYADHQNKADIAATKAREWLDVDGVDVLVDIVTSSVALAVQEVARQAHKLALYSGPATSRLTGTDCSPVGIHWAYDTYSLAVGTGRAVVREGGDSWFFLTVDYAFGHSLEKDTIRVVEAEGGTVLGTVRTPFPTADFSSFLLQAQASGAKIIGLANAGQDAVNSVKQAKEFGIVEMGQKLAGLLVFISDAHALGAETAQGLLLTAGFYWDLDEATRAFSARFYEHLGAMPTMVHAGVYSSTLHYLRAVEAAGSDDTDAVLAKMKELPIDDFFAKNGYIREDGRMVHDMFLFRVKTPEQSTGEWDLYELIRVIPGDEAFRPLASSACPLLGE
jgi:branched-chain amino acid transport system substrate-binding protein